MSDRPDPTAGVPAAFRSATTDQPHAPVDPLGDAGHDRTAPSADPLKLCVATTVAVIAWLITPPLAVALFAAMALVAYARARRAGLMVSRCALGDTRLVLAYLAVACAAGVAEVVWRVLAALG